MLEQPVVKIDEASATVTYIGTSFKDNATNLPVWDIIRITSSGGQTDVQRPKGLGRFQGVWDDRATYTYV